MSLETLTSQLPCQARLLQPFGLEIHAEEDRQLSIDRVLVDWLKPLLLEHRLVVLRGFKEVEEKEQFSNLGRQWGELLEWNFGTVFEVVEHADPTNYLFTSGSVPYHWDGAFADRVPWLQFFYCREADSQTTGGETIFCNTAALWKSLGLNNQEVWKSVEIEYATEKVAHYGGLIRTSLVARHPLTDETVLRFAEPANATTVPLNTPSLQVRGIPVADVPNFLAELTELIYDNRFVYAHRWKPGDFVLADNYVLLHGRNKYQQNLSRRLWRVHILS